MNQFISSKLHIVGMQLHQFGKFFFALLYYLNLCRILKCNIASNTHTCVFFSTLNHKLQPSAEKANKHCNGNCVICGKLFCLLSARAFL